MLKIPSGLRAFIFGIVFALIVGWASSVGSFAWLNLKAHDGALKLPLLSAHENRTLLINNDLEPSKNLQPRLDELLIELAKLKPRSVVLLSRAYWPKEALSDLREPTYGAFTAAFEHPVIKPVTLFEFTAIDGVYRQFSLPQQQPNAATLYGFAATERSQGYLNFFDDIQTIANLPLSSALAGNLIAPLVTDKVVLIDLDFVSVTDSLYTPVGPASMGQMQALAAHTYLTESDIQLMPTLVTMALVLATFTLFFFAMQLMSPRPMLLFMLVMLVVTVVVAIFALSKWHLLLPLSELLLTQLGSAVYLLVVTRLREENTILKISADLNARLSKKVQPPSFYQSDNPWDSLHTLINQQLNLNRSIFLSKVPKDHRVQAIHALNCSIEDIKEMRRDYQRTPYSEAIALHKPLKLNRPYFKTVDDQELEYMCPLMFGSEVLGFWALTVIPQQGFNQTVFENNLVHFSREITELLFHRENFLRRSEQESSLLRRFFGMKLAESEYKSLNNSVSMLEKRFSSLQFVFDGLSTASALYNLFGQILHANQRMDQLVQQWQLPIYNLTAHDFLVKLSGLDSEDIKQRLLQVTLHNAQMSLRVSSEHDVSEYILRIRAIDVATDKSEQGFLLLGLLFEFVDISEAQKVISMKKDLYSQYFHQMRNNLSTLNLISRQLGKVIPEQKKSLVDMLNQTLDECTKVNVVIEDQLAEQRLQRASVVPLNPVSQLKNCIDGRKELLIKKQIQVLEDSPAIISLILAEPAQLTGIFTDVLDLLIEDSDSNGSSLTIDVRETQTEQDQGKIMLNFRNEGYGMPQENLDRFLQLLKESPTELAQDGEKLEQLLLSVHQANYWGVELDIQSTLGSGFDVQLSIPVFVIK